MDLARSPEDFARWVVSTPRPSAETPPDRSYFICATPRCGSWFLSGLLASTGVAGRPHEWFWRDTRASLERAWGVAGDEYVQLVLAAGTTPNGVFGAKVMWASLPDLAPFPRPSFVWLRRRDRLAQAVSFAKAVQTGHWHHWDPEPREVPSYRFDVVDTLLREVEELDRQWEGWFEREGLEPLELGYEQLVGDPVAATLRVLGFLSLELPPGVSIRPLTLGQSGGASEDWAARYREDAG